MNENKFLESIFPNLKQGQDIIIGPGDDCAVIDIGNKTYYYLISVDQIISNVHFNPQTTTPEEAGAKLLKRNISDIAAMGGMPAHAVITIASDSFNNKWLLRFYEGLTQEANKWNISICGGDIASLPSPRVQSHKLSKNNEQQSAAKQCPINQQLLVTTLTITGFVKKKNLCLRKNAEVDDLIFVTGTFGDSYHSKHHLSFTPRIKESEFLSGIYTKTMIDVSDGLLLDLNRIINASNVSAQIDTKTVPCRTKKITTQGALSDGEDYELIFTVKKDKSEKLKKTWPFTTRLTEIGKVINKKETDNKIQIIDIDNTNLINKYGHGGWDHLI